MTDKNIKWTIPITLVKKYLPSLYRHPYLYRSVQVTAVYAEQFLRQLYVGLLLILMFLLIIYFSFYGVTPMKPTIQTNFLLIFALAFLCTSCLLLVESYSKKIIRDTFVLKRLLQDQLLTKRKLNTRKKFDLDALIPILAIKKFISEDEEQAYFLLLPQKVGSVIKTAERSKAYSINNVSILDADGRYVPWTFSVMANDVEKTMISKALGDLWVDLLRFEIKTLSNQRKVS